MRYLRINFASSNSAPAEERVGFPRSLVLGCLRGNVRYGHKLAAFFLDSNFTLND